MKKRWMRRIAAVLGIASRGEVLGKLERMWPDPLERERAQKELDRYGLERHEGEVARVQLAVLKLSEGSLDLLAETIKAAKQDYRDVLMWAERDRQQYVHWREE